MDRRQRLAAAASGDQPDRVPVGAWGHFYTRETTAEGMAGAMLDFQHTFGWDFIKIHARASYHVEGFGFRYEASKDPAVLHRTTSQVIRTPEDWLRLRPLGLDDPALAEQFRVIELIRAQVPADMPLIMTVFSPLDVADKLMDRQPALLRKHIEDAPDAVGAALQTFAATFAPFVRALAGLGIDGIYFSTKWVNRHKLTAAAYRKLAMEHDLAVLAEARGLWCNMVHVCEDGVDLSAVADYPAQVIHWDNCAPGNPTLAEGAARLGRAVGGGVDAATLAEGTPEQVFAIARRAVAETEGRGLILGPGCSVRIAHTPAANLHALRKAVES